MDAPDNASSVELFDTTQLALERAIQGAAVRQTALADNIANANTPGYRRKDVDFQSALRGAMAGGKSALESLTFTPQPDMASQVRADGSSVDIDQEASYLAQTGLEYEGLVQVARGRIDILESAIGPAH
jgi:flagellar basal-body rod protein FlgB